MTTRFKHLEFSHFSRKETNQLFLSYYKDLLVHPRYLLCCTEVGAKSVTGFIPLLPMLFAAVWQEFFKLMFQPTFV